MNEHTIKRLFPNASRSTFAANAVDTELSLEIEGLEKAASGEASPGSAKLERSAGHGTLVAGQAEKGNSGRFLVRVTSVRRRLIDEDNLCEKYVVDCCRYSGLLPSDDPAKTRIETAQRKAGKEEAEHTLIEIFSLGNS